VNTIRYGIRESSSIKALPFSFIIRLPEPDSERYKELLEKSRNEALVEK